MMRFVLTTTLKTLIYEWQMTENEKVTCNYYSQCPKLYNTRGISGKLILLAVMSLLLTESTLI